MDKKSINVDKKEIDVNRSEIAGKVKTKANANKKTTKKLRG